MAKEKLAKAVKGDGKVTIKVVSLESRGSDIIVNENGKTYQMQSEAIVRVPKGVLEILKNAKVRDVDVSGDLEEGNTVRKKTISERFFVVELPDREEKKDDTILDTLSDNEDID